MPSHSTTYRNTFISVSPDTRAVAARIPSDPASVAGLHHALIAAAPYGMTSDDVIHAVHCRRAGDAALSRAAFFAKGQPCLRTSPLVRSHGWGIHHDAQGCVALIAMEDPRYADMAARDDLRQIAGMRATRG